MWTYSQSKHALSHDGQPITDNCYSGHDRGLNNPAMQDVFMIGPLPQGTYRIDPAIDHPHLGPVSMPLIPAPTNEMHGRGGFYIHGDNALHDDSASEGCIVVPDRNIRAEISESQDRVLEVIG